MSIWDNLTNAGQGVVETTKEVFAVTRLKGQKAEVQKGLDLQYQELGKKYMEICGEEAPESLAQTVQEIRISLDQIRAIDQQIDDIRGKKLCPFCEKPLLEDALFCAYCGKRLADAESAEAEEEPAAGSAPAEEPAKPAVLTCPHCGGENREGSIFCMHCGKKMVE